MRVWKCDSCQSIIEDTPPVTANLLIDVTADDFDDFDDDDDDECPEYEMCEYQFCALTCLAAWAMNEALTHNEVRG